MNRHERSRAVIEEIAAERERQVTNERWSLTHDDQHTEEELALAAVCYAHPKPKMHGWSGQKVPMTWPWDGDSWKPKDRRRNLVRAAALIVAEIERSDREKTAILLSEETA